MEYSDNYSTIKPGLYNCEVMMITSNEERITFYVLYKDNMSNSLRPVSVYYTMKAACRDMSFYELVLLLKSCGLQIDNQLINAMYNSIDLLREECIKRLMNKELKLLVTTKITGFKELRLAIIE